MAKYKKQQAQRAGLSRRGIVEGNVFEIRGERKWPGPLPTDQAELFIPSLLNFPTNASTQTKTERNDREVSSSSSWDSASFNIDNRQVEIYKGELHTVIKCQLPTGSVALNQHLRIRDALQFVLAQPVTPCAMNLWSGDTQSVVLQSQGFSNEKTSQQRPPLRFESFPPRSEIFSMAERFYKSISNITSERGHDVSIAVNVLVAAASADVQTQALVIPVAAETLIRTCFPDIIPSDPEFESEAIHYRDRMDRKTMSAKLYNKLKNSLDYYLDKSHRGNSLREFVKTRGLNMALFDAWSYLRNRHAHGEPIAEGNYEDTITKIRLTLHLCYTIILAFIGYSGPRTNYERLGFRKNGLCRERRS
jgi:hypothetical protein